jgi:hypothetical protein
LFLPALPDTAPDPDALAEAHRLALAKLRVMGMEIAEGLHAQSKAPDADLGEVATKFSRVARAVRQTIALEARLAEAARWLASEQARAEAANRTPDPPPYIQKLGIDRAEAYRRCAENKLEAVTLVRRAMAKVPGLDRNTYDARLDERLDDDCYDKEFDAKVDIAETIRGICRDLGLDPDWQGFSSLDWRQVSRETRAALTGEPIEALPPALYDLNPPDTLPERTMPVPPRHRVSDFMTEP